MAHISVSPQTANLKDGDNERLGTDLEDGELEDGELDDVEPSASSAVVKEQTAPKLVVTTSSSTNNITTPTPAKKEKSKEAPSVRVGSKRKSVHHHNRPERSKDGSEPEDEWAGVVEKAIKRAMAKDSPSGKDDAVETTIVAGNQSPDEEKKYKRKKRKKKHREDEEEERKESKKRKRSHHWADVEGIEDALEEKVHDGEDEEDEDEDDDEMLFIRGASPIMRCGYLEDESSPSSSFMDNPYSFNEKGLQYDENYDSYNEDESDFDNRDDFSRCSVSAIDDDAPKRGMGRGVKRRQRGLGRLMQQNKRQGRKENKNKRGGSKRQQQMRNNQERGSDCICMFYMQGKCQKGDDCPYSHNALPPRKMELCKFYLMDCCAKKDKCLYMHHDFPCKFYHTGLKCFSGPRCKFSHGHLTDTMRAVLLKHLETAPKEILGDFPRLSREGAAAMVYNKKNRGNKAKKIPSLFDIEVPIPAQLLAEQKEAEEENSPSRRTPMPDESDNEEQERATTSISLSPKMDAKSPSKTKSHRWNSDDDTFSHETHVRDSNDEFEDERKVSYDDRNFSEQLDEFSVRRSLKPPRTDEGDKKKDENLKIEGRTKRELNLLRLAGYSPNPTVLDDGKRKLQSSVDTMALEVDSSLENEVEPTEMDTEEVTKPQSDSALEYQRDSQPDTGESGTESNDGASIPLHLPKKQRELFLRIQQQQRQADSSQDQSGDDDGDEDSQQEENWYSSDEEEDSLTNVLKNLSRQEEQSNSKLPATEAMTTTATSTATMTTAITTTATTEATTTTTTTATTTTTTTTNPTESFDKFKLADLSQIDISESVSKLLSSIRHQHQTEDSNIVTTTSGAEQLTPPQHSNPSPARDPRLSRDPRNRSQTNPLVTGTTTCVTADTTTAVPTVTTTTTAITTINSLSSPSSLESGLARRSDPRRVHDPRKPSHRSETSEHRHHGGSISTRRSSGISSAPTFTSIYSNAITSDTASPSLSTRLGLNLPGQIDIGSAGDIDFRNFLSLKDLEHTDVDLRQGNKSDLDLRTVQQTSVSYGDTDLRLKSQDFSSVGQLMDSGRGNSDVDFRRILELPFKPVPMHTPATEIDASLTSHLPIPYKVVVVTIPRPDYTSLKLNTADPQVHSDPRLRKLFKLSSTPSSTSPTKNSSLSLASPASRSDPRSLMSRGGRGNSGSGGGHFQVPGGISNLELHDAQVHMMPDRFSECPTVSTTSSTISKPQKEIMMSNPHMMHSAAVPGILPNLTLPSQNNLLPNFDPRMPRNPRHAPGILGPAPLPVNYCPNTPLFEEQEENSNGSDNDSRMFYNRGNPMEVAIWEQQQQPSQPPPPPHSSQRNTWRSGRRNQQQRYMEQDFRQRSYTPPA